jgi:hypothetical protein
MHSEVTEAMTHEGCPRARSWAQTRPAQGLRTYPALTDAAVVPPGTMTFAEDIRRPLAAQSLVP